MSTTCLHRFSRRCFLQTVATSTVAAVLHPALLATAEDRRPKPVPVGSNIYGWGQYYQRAGKDLNANLEDVLSALRDAGYDYLEGNLDTKQLDNNERFADRCRAKGLKPVCLYTGGRLHEASAASASVERILAAAAVSQKAGFTLIDCNPDPIGRAKTDDELAVQSKALNELGTGLSRLGIQLGVHNHTPEMANQAREFHSNLDHTDPKTVGLCYDVHWVFRGGVKPADCLRQYGPRVVSWHLRQSRNGVWWEDLDSGDVDYELAAQYVKDHQLSAPYTVELALEQGTAVTRSVVENHRRSREFVRRVFGV